MVDPDGTLDSDEVPVIGGTNDGAMDPTIADFRQPANASQEVTTIDEKEANRSLGDMGRKHDRTTRHVQIAMTNKSSAQASSHPIDCPDPGAELTDSTVECSGHKNRSTHRKQANLDNIENEQISIRSRTKRNDSLKSEPCVKKARAPMNPKIACPCMRQLWEPLPKGTRHTEPPSVFLLLWTWCKTRFLSVTNPPRVIKGTRLQITIRAVPSEVPGLSKVGWNGMVQTSTHKTLTCGPTKKNHRANDFLTGRHELHMFVSTQDPGAE